MCIRDRLSSAAKRLESMSSEEKNRLKRNIIAGLPGSNEKFTLQAFRQALLPYNGISAATLKICLIDFLRALMPVCEETGVRLVIPPGGPPYPMLGLPRGV